MATDIKSNIIKSLRITDFVAIALVLCVAVFFILGTKPTEGNTKKLVLLSGDMSIPLAWTDRTFNISELTGKNMIIDIKGDKARVLASSCPDKLCVHSGWVSDCGHIAACLPNGVALMVECRGDLNVTDTVTE